MTILPPFLADLIFQHLKIIEAWFSQRLYEQVTQHASRHPLVRLQARLDWSEIESGCRAYHHQSGPGAKPTHSLSRLVRALLVKYLYSWSYRQTEDRIRHDLVIKWFVGYGLWDAVLDASTLCLFEQWVNREQRRIFFDSILHQIDQDFPEERQAVQMGDTFALRANAAQETMVELLRHTSRLLLTELAQMAPETYQQIRGAWDETALFGSADEVQAYWQSEDERKACQETTVRAAWHLAHSAAPLLEKLDEPVRTRAQIRVADLKKIIQDEYWVKPESDAVLEDLREREAQHKGAYRLCSATDREATCRNHGGDRTVGYNISLSVTPRSVIREIMAATGAEPDQAGVADLIRSQRQHQQLCPVKLIYDQAAGAGRTRAEVARVSAGQTQLVARIPPSTSPDRFGPEAFHLTATGALECPQQRTTSSRYRSGSREGDIFEFSAKTCRDCPLWDQCRDPHARPNGPRRVFWSDYQAEIHAAQAYNQTEAFRQDMQQRPGVERVISMLTRYDGARRARGRGMSRVDFQVKMSAAGRNLRTWLTLWDQKLAQRGAMCG